MLVLVLVNKENAAKGISGNIEKISYNLEVKELTEKKTMKISVIVLRKK